VNAEREQTVLEYLEPVPTPSGVSSRELVRRAIEYAAPPRLPYSFFRPLRSDFCELVFVEEAILGRPGRERGELYRDEWGIVRKVSGGRWDQVVEHPLSDLTRLERARFPAAEVAERTARLAPWVERARKAGKYCLGFDPVLMFERACDLVGFEELLVAPYTQPQQLEALLDQLADLSVSAIEQWHQIGGVDGFMTWEDWGHQAGLPLKLETFRRFYKPRYARIVEAAHRRGMHFIWHNCGQIREMIPEMIELGVDVVQMDQPRLVGRGHPVVAAGGSQRRRAEGRSEGDGRGLRAPSGRLHGPPLPPRRRDRPVRRPPARDLRRLPRQRMWPVGMRMSRPRKPAGGGRAARRSRAESKLC
jgi:hypothetical protein